MDLKRYFWVDIIEGCILSIDQNFTDFKKWKFDDQVCAIVAANYDRCLIAFSQQLAWFMPATGVYELIADMTVATEQEIFNDAKVDQLGRFWIGSKDREEQSPNGRLYCYDGIELRIMDQGFIVSNGIDWNHNSKFMYIADSPNQVIYKYDFDLLNGTINNKKPFIRVKNGYPDGMCVDASDQLWSAHWDGYGISNYSKQGRTINFHELSAQRVTSCCYGGDELDQLFITTASKDLETNDTNNGYCFMLENVGQGLSQTAFNPMSKVIP